MKSRGFVPFSFVLAAVVALSSCGGPSGDKSKKDEGSIFKRAAKGPVPVTTYVAAAREVPLVINAEGKTEASERYQAKAPGDVKVQSISVEEGAKVEPGDPLLKFDEEKIRLKLALARAEAQEGDAEAALVSDLQRNRDALVAEEKLSEAEAGILDERLNYAQAKAERARAEIEYLERSNDLKELNAPFSGVVMKRQVSEGASVEEDQVLLEVVKLDPIFFTFPIASDVVTALEKEKGVEAVVRLQGVPQELTGEIAALGVEAKEGESAGGGLEVRVRLPNPDLALKPDMRGAAEIRTTGKRRIMPVPDTAVVKGDKTNYVFKVDGKQVRRVAVELGGEYNGHPTVAKGLNEGDTIVSSAEGDLKDGAEIEVQATKSALQ